jgi:hypothetical protein
MLIETSMPYERLLNQGRIKAYKVTPAEVQRLLQISRFNAAQKNLDVSPDWAYAMAYNAALQSCRLSVERGYRPRGENSMPQSWYAEESGINLSDQIGLLDQMRESATG